MTPNDVLEAKLEDVKPQLQRLCSALGYYSAAQTKGRFWVNELDKEHGQVISRPYALQKDEW